MSRKSRRQPKSSPSAADLQRLIDAAIERKFTPPLGARPLNQDALAAQMQAQMAPQAKGTPMFSPGAPLKPSPGLVIPEGPRQLVYPVGYNINSVPRSTETNSFATLRNLAMLYDGIQLCEQVWLDVVAKLTLVLKPRPEIIAEQGQQATKKYADRVRKYSDFFAYPDKGNGLDLKSWLRMAVRDQLQIDAVSIFMRPTRGGELYSMELIDSTTIKPLIDDRGRRPQPPYPAFQQFYYGVPDGWYTSNEMLYLRETTRTESVYGLSRIERIILRINQALRKENKDLARFTDGNMPNGILTPPDDGSAWTPETLLAYQEMWDALLAGNDQARSRIRVIQPGSVLTPTDEKDIFVDFDRFLLNLTAACYSMTMADLGFTENVNKSSGESQQNVFYRRAVEPLMDRYAELFTYVLRNYFGEQDLIVSWAGFEESEDFNAMAASYVSLVSTGIVSPSAAARLMNLPWNGPDIPPYVMVQGQGLTFLEDAADPAMRSAANDAKKAGYELAKNPPGPQDNDAGAAKGDEGQRPPTGSDDSKRPNAQPLPPKSGKKDSATTLRMAPPLPSGDIERSDGAPKYTGITVAFMIKPDVATQLALPDGEPSGDLHCTLAYLGDTGNGPVVDQGKLGNALTDFASKAQALQGQTGGIARFALSESSEGKTPIIALVNCPGLQEWRRGLVDAIEGAGYHVASDFDFTPHITLKYVDPGDPMPVDDLPVLPLDFDAICLAVGDDRQYFPLQPTERQENPDFFVRAVDSGGHRVKRNFPWRQS